MVAGVKTSPEVEAEAVRLIREGRTRRQVSEATGVSTRVLTRIAKDAGVEWARTGSGSSGTPEAAAKARGYRSEYMRTRREGIADRLLSQMDRTLDLLESEVDARKRQALMQGLDAASRSYTNVTKPDAILSEQESMREAMSMLDTLVRDLTATSIEVPPEEGTFEE